jgi:hypothetical protein
MILEPLICIANELNAFLKTTFHLQEDKVVLSALVNQDGTVAVQGENKIVLTVINLMAHQITVNHPQTVKYPHLEDIYIMASAYFNGNNYSDSLKILSLAMDYLEEHPIFTGSNLPTLDHSISSIKVARESLTAEQLYPIWSALGAKYMPSVVYKLTVEKM